MALGTEQNQRQELEMVK